MKKINPNLVTLLLITIGILFIIFYLKDASCSKDVVVENPYNYKTDTIISKEYFKLLTKKEEKEDKEETPPRVVIKWLTPPAVPIDSIKRTNNAITFYTVGQKPIIYSNSFLTNYPNADKLLKINLSKDSLDITTFSPNSVLKTNKYPIFLDRYSYIYYENELHHIEKKHQQTKTKTQWNQLYLNTGYSITQSSTLIGMEYNLNLGRFKIDLETNFTIQEKPDLNLDAKIGYRLFK